MVDNENATSPAALAISLRMLLAADSGERARLASNDYEAVRAEHSRQAVVSPYLELYRHLAGAR